MSKNKKNKREQKRPARKYSGRLQVVISLAIGLLVLAVAVYWSQRQSTTSEEALELLERLSPEQEVQAVSDEEIAELQQIITKTEEEIAKLRLRLQPLVDKVGLCHVSEDMFWTAFDLIEQNQANPRRNRRLLVRQYYDKEIAVNGGGMALEPAPLNYFSYELFDGAREISAIVDLSKSQAVFSPFGRVVILQNSFDPSSILDQSTLLHEVIHCAQDNQMIVNYGQTHRDQMVMSLPKSAVVIDFEAWACAQEVELFNLLCEGYLQQSLQAKDANAVVDEVCRRMNIPPARRNAAAWTCWFAQTYFSKTPNGKDLPASYINAVAKFYSDLGHKPIRLQVKNAS